MPLTTVRVMPIDGIWISAIGSPSAGSVPCTGATEPSVATVVGGANGSVVVVVGAEVEVVVLVAAPSSSCSNSLPSSRWDCWVCRPVPHSW